jgi:hypothetical protein
MVEYTAALDSPNGGVYSCWTLQMVEYTAAGLSKWWSIKLLDYKRVLYSPADEPYVLLLDSQLKRAFTGVSLFSY